MDNLTLIGAIASIISLAIQVFNFFPRLGHLRGYFFAASVGFFVGSLIRAFEPATLSFNVEITFGVVILSTVFLLVIGFVLAGALSPHNRDDFWRVSLLLFLAFSFGCLFVFSQQIKSEELTISELNHLSELAVERGDINRALIHLEVIQSRVQADEKRRDIILDRIDNLRRKEIE